MHVTGGVEEGSRADGSSHEGSAEQEDVEEHLQTLVDFKWTLASFDGTCGFLSKQIPFLPRGSLLVSVTNIRVMLPYCVSTATFLYSGVMCVHS